MKGTGLEGSETYSSNACSDASGLGAAKLSFDPEAR